VPQSLKDRILKEVDINQDGVIDYEEFLQLGKAWHAFYTQSINVDILRSSIDSF
jgi:hypothetical protein